MFEINYELKAKKTISILFPVVDFSYLIKLGHYDKIHIV
jgi:hypothetical protein